MCEENVGYVLTLKNLYNESDESSICFKPLHPPLTLRSHLVWKKYKVFPKAIEIFLEILNEEIKKKAVVEIKYFITAFLFIYCFFKPTYKFIHAFTAFSTDTNNLFVWI